MKMTLKCGVMDCKNEVYLFAMVVHEPENYKSMMAYPLCKKHSDKLDKKMFKNSAGDESDLAFLTGTLNKMKCEKFDVSQFSYLMQCADTDTKGIKA